MKAKFFIFIFFLFIAVLFPQKANAQSFNCTWNNGACVFSNVNGNCNESNSELDLVCRSAAGSHTECNSLGAINCTVGGTKTAASIYCSGGQGKNFINTALGCIPVGSTQDLLKWLFRWGLQIGGGLAFLMILVAGFQITTSQGDPRKLQAGKELLIASISGLLFLIFSTFILRIVGVDILNILPS